MKVLRSLLNRLGGHRLVGDAPQGWTCAVCGQVHDSLPAVAIPAPAVWLEATDEEQTRDFFLNSDLCVWKDEHFFVRCRLELPLTDRAGSLDFGVWSTLSGENFKLYRDTFDSRDDRDLPPMFGWFANQLPGYPPTLNLKVTVRARTDGLRPLIELEPTDHPLAVQQRQGIGFAAAVAYVHAHLDM